MTTTPNALQLIGNTPLVRLAGPSEATGCEILAKCEFMNPGGSVKDRAALAIIEDAEAQGTIGPGGIIVEGTAGNTGIGLALVGNAKGYRTIIVMTDTQSREKQDTLKALGAELVLVAPTAYSNPAHYVHTSRRIAEETPNALWANQFDNTANRMAHIRTTAGEIWEQTGGKVDGLTTPQIAWRISARPLARSGSRPAARSMASPAPSALAGRLPASGWASRSAIPMS